MIIGTKKSPSFPISFQILFFEVKSNSWGGGRQREKERTREERERERKRESAIENSLLATSKISKAFSDILQMSMCVIKHEIKLE